MRPPIDLSALGLVVVLPFLWLSHSLPHLPGPQPDSLLELPEGFARRGADLLQGDGTPYPVHVDEHFHIAQFAEIERTGDILIGDPYTGEEPAGTLFSVPGMRSERGWQVAMVQFHHLSGLSFPAMSHLLPAVWASYLGLCLWLLLRPAPGALVAAALTAILPTTLRFLGVGFLVPSAFALPWILAVMAVALRASGPGRLIVLSILVTGAFFMHLVPGVLALTCGLAVAALRPDPRSQRLGLVAAMLLPMLWIYPAIAADARVAILHEHELPFEADLFRSIGLALLGLVAVGTAWAFLRRDESAVPGRTFALLCGGIILSLVWSIRTGHHNEATYGRLIPAFFLSLAALGGLAVGAMAMQSRMMLVKHGEALSASVTAGLVVVLTVAGLAVPMQARLAEPYYRTFDATSWDAAIAFGASGASQEDVFLAHPWQAPILNAFTGAAPWTVLYPGAPPVRGGDYGHYLRSGGADADWLAARGIDYVVSPVPPNAPHDVIGPQTYRLRGEAGG